MPSAEEDDDWVLFRGGVSDLRSLQAAIVSAVDDEDVQRPELTVFRVLPHETVAAVVARNAVQARYKKVRLSSVGALRALGFELVDCDEDGHCQVVFDKEPTNAELERFASAFGRPEPAPVSGDQDSE
jgi:hypothetical protein